MTVWVIKLEREIEETFFGHMRQDAKPTEKEVFMWLAKEHYITDDPGYSELDVWLVEGVLEEQGETKK